MGAIALASHLGESDAIAIGSEVKQNQTVSTANETIAVPINVGLNDTIQLTITNNGTGAKTQREIAIGDEITQLFFGEAKADSVGKGSNSGPGVIVTQLETISEQVPVVPVVPVQQDANVGTAFDSLAVPIDSRPPTVDSIAIGAEELGIQQTVKKVDELITQVQQETNNFGVPVITAGDSFTASETDKLQFPTEMVDSKIFQVEQETINGGAAPSVTADIVTSTGTTGEGFQINLAGVQEMGDTPIDGLVDQMTTQIPIFWPSGDEPGKFKIEHTINPNTEESVNKMQTSVNFSGAAKQIPIFINSKIKHAVFNIHVQASSPTSQAVHGNVKKPEDYSLDIEIGVPAIQPPTEMPNLPQLAQVKEIDLELPDLIAIPSGSTESPVYQVPSVAQVNSFDIDKISLGEINQTPTTPADTFTIDTAQNGDQLLLVQPAEIPNAVSDDRTMRSPLALLSIVPNPAQQVNNGRLPSPPVINSEHIDDAVDDNISLEIIGFIPRNQLPINNNQTVVETRRPILVKFDDVSAEVLGRFNGSQAIFLSRPSSVKVSSHGENRQNGPMVVQSVRIDPVQPTNTINGDDNSGEIDVDVSVEKADIRTNLSRHSDEQDENMSLEVDFDLLPQIKRLLRRQFQKKPKNPKMVFFHHHSDEQDDDAFELNNILANPVFQRKLQEMDERFKSAPEARGKRLMEKYAEALAMSSSHSAAAATINFSLYFPLLIACLLVNWSS